MLVSCLRGSIQDQEKWLKHNWRREQREIQSLSWSFLTIYEQFYLANGPNGKNNDAAYIEEIPRLRPVQSSIVHRWNERVQSTWRKTIYRTYKYNYILLRSAVHDIDGFITSTDTPLFK